MFVGLIVAFLIAATSITIFGAGERGTVAALRFTARWSFVLFWLAYVGQALVKLFGSPFSRLAQNGRNLGLAYAAAQTIHVGLVLWLIHISTDSGGDMLVFWAGIACTYLLVLFSWPRVRGVLGPRGWLLLRTVAVEYIAYVFAVDFILLPLQSVGSSHYPRTYVPIALMLLVGVGLRISALVQSTIIKAPVGDSRR
jgi:hypothetical protein